MENSKPIRKKSIELNSYRVEEINKVLTETQEQEILYLLYLDSIRNYKIFTEEMIENIKKMDDDKKIAIISEYNKVIKSIISLLD